MADVYITELHLLKAPLENDYKITLYFASATEQYEYFYARRMSAETSYTDFSYQRKEGYIRVPTHYDTLLAKGVNYIMYKNKAYSNKWFYAFITDMKYVDDGRTDIYFEIDVMQTWMFDITVRSSFVEREHCTDDTAGLHTYPEGLETGEYVCNGHLTDPNLTGTSALNPTYIVMGITETFDVSEIKYGEVGAKPVHGIYSGQGYLAAPTGGYETINAIIEEYADSNESTLDAISCLFIAPSFLVDGESKSFTDAMDNTHNVLVVKSSTSPASYESKVLWNTNLNGYGDSVKNNKLLTYPYNYLLATNDNGGSAVYQYELFNGAVPGSAEKALTFKVYGVLCPGCSIRMVPVDYKNGGENDDEGLNLGKFPICNWAGDAYTNWMTQNSLNVATQALGGVVQIAGGIALVAGTGGLGAGIGGGSIAGGVSTILGTMAEMKKQSMQPPQIQGNINCGDVVTASKRNAFHFYNMSVKKEYAQIIDNYFTMFGYKTCRVKTPASNHRPHFWYTKTIDVNIDIKSGGNGVPNKDMQKIKDCYNNGITFWKADGTIGDYSVDNSIN